MGGPSKERRWGEMIRHAEQRARETRFMADVAACDAWNYRMEGYGGPAQPSPPISDALNAGFRYLEVKCAGCSTHSTVDLTTIRRPREHQFGSLNSGCVAGRVPRPAVIRTSAATWSDSGARTSRRGKNIAVHADSLDEVIREIKNRLIESDHAAPAKPTLKSKRRKRGRPKTKNGRARH